MPSFLVDSRTLLAVRDTLGRLHDQLLGMPITAQRYDGVLGGRALEGALQQFCGRWHWGLVQISGQMADMMGRLSVAAAAYQRIEDRITPSGSGTTVIGGTGGAPVGAGGGQHPQPGSGSRSGTTVIG
jgi:hypothetical protein